MRHQSHYVDITGEVVWVRSLIDRHHARAAAEGTRIVPFCGFDSIPSDLGAFLAVRHLQRGGGAPCREVRGYFRMRGGLNGGTVASMFHLTQGAAADRAGDPFLLDPHERSPAELAASHDPTGASYDEAIGAWVGPFVMGRVNTRVVRRSAGLFAGWGEPYGARTVYQEYARYGARRGHAKAALVSAGLRWVESGLKHRPTRRLLKALLPKPGQGPSEQEMDEGFFSCEVLAFAEDGRRARVVMHHKGDPGNRATTKLVCESALCLALEGERLPGGPARGGVLTPATAFGDVLAERLRGAGLAIEVGK